jgi:hypothetical protein
MTDVLYRITDENADVLTFTCPACGYGHGFHLRGHPKGCVWNWNGSMDKPTFTPSLLVHECSKYPRCHLILTNGIVHFCGDCGHDMAGKKVPLKPVDD